jgi:ATP-binding cassette subfamily B protein
METLLKLQSYMAGRKILIPLSLIFSALSSLVSMLPFVFIWLVVRDLFKYSGNIAETQINIYAWWAVGTAIAGVFFYFVALMSSHLAAFRVEVNMRREAMQKIVNMPLGFFDKNSSGRIRKIIDDDTSTTHTFLAHQLPDMAGSILIPLATLILIFVFNWRLGLACLVPIIFAFSTMSMMIGGTGKKFQRLYLDAQEEMSSEAVEYVRGIPVVKVFQQTVFSFKRFYGSIVKYKEMVIKYTQNWEKPMSFYTTIIHSFAFFLVPVAILLISHSGNYASVLSDLFLYVLITPVFATSIMKSMHLNQNLFLAGEAVKRVENLINVEPLEVSKNPQKIKSHAIVFKDVKFRYPNAVRNAVDGVNFVIPEGKTYALVGASGGGKTTIARLIPRFWDIAEGSISIGGVDVRHLAKEELMNKVSFVFQNTKLFKTTLLENIKYGNPDAENEEVERAVDLAQCREIIDRLPDGLNTKIGVEGTYLSGGEQQRIALARAILKDAPIVVLDEATAFTDPENEHLIQQALGKLTKGKTVLMIAHRLTSIQDVDEILVIEKGKIAEQGTQAELIAQNTIYSKMWAEYQKAVAWTV